MRSTSGISGGKLWSCIPFSSGRRKAANEDIKLDPSVGDGPTPTSAVEVLELELAEERAKCARLEKELERVKAEAEAFAEAKGRAEDEVQEVKGLLEVREKEVGRKDASIQWVEKDIGEMQTKLTDPQITDARARELSARLDEKDKLLMERTMELNAAQAFLTKVDTISEAEVMGMVENLNTLIASASGVLSDNWDQREWVPGTLVEGPDLKQIRDYFGDPMFEQIAARNPAAVTLAIRMYLGHFAERVTSSWGGGEAAGTLGEIYKMISTKEGQTIASRWKTLTKRHIPHQEPPRGEEIMGDLARILAITQSFPDFSEAMKCVGNSAESEVKAIIEATLQLDATIKTEFTSSDVSVYIVPPGAVFTEETMENEFGEDGTREGGERRIVAGMVEIGLLQRMGNVEKVLRKPKVILERDLIELEGQ